MTLPKVSPGIALCFAIAFTCTIFALFSDTLFTWLNLDRAQVAQGQYWRLLSCNFVHFGWAHTLMNIPVLFICGPLLFAEFSLMRIASLLLVCCLTVGIGIYWLNPEYQQYAGLSGALHGLLVAGFFANKRHATWVNALLIALVFAKIIYEHMPNYDATEIQKLMPVPVAYDSHLYGGLAGLCFGFVDFFVRRKEGNP